MVEKKLNFNQPILSVRRYSPKIPSQNTDRTTIERPFPAGVPRLHPFRSELNSGPVRNSGAIPFQWEQIPGKPKEQIKRQSVKLDRPSMVAELSPSRYPNISSDDEMEDGDCDEAFVDEVDSQSKTESNLSSCSNGMDDQDAESSRRFSTNPREFVIGRFLPIAHREQQSSVEQSDKVKREKEKSGFWYRPTFAKTCSLYNDNEEEKEERDDRVRNTHEKTVCCLLPRSCIKSSVCILDPGPAMSVRACITMFDSGRVLSGSSSADSLSETGNEDRVKPVGRTDELKENKDSVVQEIAGLGSCDALTYYDGPLSFVEGFGSRTKRFKTLQELLADEDYIKELESSGTDPQCIINSSLADFKTSRSVDRDFNIVSSVDKSDRKWGKTMPEPFGRDDDLYIDSNFADNMEAAAKKAAKQLSRITTLGNSFHEKHPKIHVPPPLLRSPSDSWLFRTMSTKKASVRSFIYRSSNKS